MSGNSSRGGSEMGIAATAGFLEAARALFAERELQLREHCALAELEAYSQGGLSEERQESVAEHLSVCENCTILLLYGVMRPDFQGRLAEPRDSEIEAAWNQLQPRLRNGSKKGRSLATLLESDGPDQDQALRLAVGISRALMALHSSGLILHALRPENVLISPSGEIDLLDLGSAPTPQTLEIGYGGSAEDAVIDLYRSMSPEQVAGEGLDQRSDLFSFGVLLYEMLTGVSPFRDSTPLGTVSRILSLEPPPVRELNPRVGEELSDLITRLLAKDADDRPSSAAAVVRELEAIIEGRGPESRARASEPRNAEEQIERLYDEIIALAQEKPATGGSNRDEEIERAYGRLLKLQEAEAERFRDGFEASLGMPVDAGQKILARVHALREELEDLASADPSTQ